MTFSISLYQERIILAAGELRYKIAVMLVISSSPFVVLFLSKAEFALFKEFYQRLRHPPPHRHATPPVSFAAVFRLVTVFT